MRKGTKRLSCARAGRTTKKSLFYVTEIQCGSLFKFPYLQRYKKATEIMQGQIKSLQLGSQAPPRINCNRGLTKLQGKVETNGRVNYHFYKVIQE